MLNCRKLNPGIQVYKKFMKKEIADIRKDYMLQTLDESNVEEDAINQFTKWWNEAVNSAIDEVNAMTLATASKDGESACTQALSNLMILQVS